MNMRAIRGATQLRKDDLAELNEAVTELLTEMLDRNNINAADVINVFFTATPDVKSGFPAAAARSLGWQDIPLICSVEMDVKDCLALVIRVMMQIQSNQSRSEIKHIYLRGAEVLRLDIAQ